MGAGLTLALFAISAQATFAPDWVDYGLMPDGSMHSWNQRAVQEGAGSFTVTSRLRYSSPQPIAGTGSKYPPAKTVYTTYLLNCVQRRVQPIAASYRDASDGVILSFESPAPCMWPSPRATRSAIGSTCLYAPR